MNLSWSELIALGALVTADGMAQLKTVVDNAPDRSREGVRAWVYQNYPWAKELFAVAADRDPEGAFQFVVETAGANFGSIGTSIAVNCRNEVYQIHAWLQGELDKPRPELGSSKQ